MGLMNWLASRGPAAKVARGVFNQFTQIKYKFPQMTEDKIARNLLVRGYLTGKSLNSKQQSRLDFYLNSQSRIMSIYDLCLAIIDIDFGISPNDRKPYIMACDIIEKELTALGYKMEYSIDSEFAIPDEEFYPSSLTHDLVVNPLVKNTSIPNRNIQKNTTHENPKSRFKSREEYEKWRAEKSISLKKKF